MPDNSKRLILLSIGVVGVTLSIGLVVYAMLIPPTIREPMQVASAGSSSLKAKDTKKPSAIIFDSLTSKRLQGPLEDPPQETLASVREVAKKPPPLPRFSAKLIGTLFDSDPSHRAAWIEIDGKNRMYQLGDEIRHSGLMYKLSAITDGVATFEVDERTIELKADNTSPLSQSRTP
ncbi:MAG: type II secretion system protein N [Planctomycetota bacterium]